MSHGALCIAAHESFMFGYCNSSQLDIAFKAVQILWVLLWLSAECVISSDATLCATHLCVQVTVTAVSTNL